MRLASALSVTLLLCASCVYPSRHLQREASTAFAAPQETRLGAALEGPRAAHPGASAVHPLATGVDALVARLRLIEAAERAIDFQYYMLHRDAVGEVVVQRLLAAADRGVRVRVLVDDLGSGGVDAWLPALSAHENVAVRYFNPLARGPLPGLARSLDMLGRFGTTNHRMHNKLLAVDGAQAVVGGRNMGDEYYGAAEQVNFADLDLVVGGPVVAELGRLFDAYWNSDHAVPVEAWSRLRRGPEALVELRAALDARLAREREAPYAERLAAAPILGELARGEVQTLWAPCRALADDPDKVVARGEAKRRNLLLTQLSEVVPEARRDVTIVSPYFVPGRGGSERLAELARGGVRVRVLTNALAATDVPAVHAGYKRYRRALLEAGVELYELMPSGEGVREAQRSELFGSSGASLHAKAFCFDGRRVFVGSLNLDPRSVDLNTELGLVVESEALGSRLLEGFERATDPQLSWRVSLDGDGRMVWDGAPEGSPERHDADPQASSGQRFASWFLGLLPIEGQL